MGQVRQSDGNTQRVEAERDALQGAEDVQRMRPGSFEAPQPRQVRGRRPQSNAWRRLSRTPSTSMSGTSKRLRAPCGRQSVTTTATALGDLSHREGLPRLRLPPLQLRPLQAAVQALAGGVQFAGPQAPGPAQRWHGPLPRVRRVHPVQGRSAVLPLRWGCLGPVLPDASRQGLERDARLHRAKQKGRVTPALSR